jgi:hypothetical protein
MSAEPPPPFLPAWSPERRNAPWRRDPSDWQRREPLPEPYGATSHEYDKRAKARELDERYEQGVARKRLELMTFGKPMKERKGEKKKERKHEHEEKEKPVSLAVQHLRHRVAIRKAILDMDGPGLRNAFKQADPLMMHNLTRDSPGVAQLEDKSEFISIIKMRLDEEEKLVEALGVTLEDGKKMREGKTLSKARLRELAAALGTPIW